MKGDLDLDTICATATPPGRGGIAVIRVSGANALQSVRQISSDLPIKLESRKAFLTMLVEPNNLDVIDQVLITFFKKGNSYTGDELVEISSHGSPVVTECILENLIKVGCRLALPGEFTYRAFMNGKIDLVQAEGVLNVIESQSLLESRVALRQLKGNLSERFSQIESELLWLLAHIEASIDFSAENLEVAPKSLLLERIEEALNEVTQVLFSFESGRRLKEGLRVAFIGRPNVGKSSLLNSVLKKPKAIVTEIAGTTRDLVEETLLIQGYRITFVDTAGLRRSNDVVEKLGIEKSYEELENCDLVFYVIDVNEGVLPEDVVEIKKIPKDRLQFLFNKIDLTNDKNISCMSLFPSFEGVSAQTNEELFNSKALRVSSFHNSCGEQIIERVRSFLHLNSFADNAVLTNLRHFENLTKTQECLGRARQLMIEDLGHEFVAQELKEGLLNLQETLGKRFDDDVLDRIFKEFCLGK